ncbi:MAG: hypothetical protein CMJ18_03390 [Phycisphaeraceae bacterium]|nr:hypothetical protein [Phycisphaeraceae bacterium]
MSGEVQIVIGPEPAAVVERAIGDLRSYLSRLFGADARVVATGDGDHPRLVVGTDQDAHVRRTCPALPSLSEQGHLLRRIDDRTLLAAGGSAPAAAWAVYELAERYGVRFLLHEDVLPPEPGPFHLPEIDQVFEPVQRIRSWRQFNDLVHGPVLWTLAQQQAFIAQVFKLKFNAVEVCLWPQHPMIDYEIDGTRRSTWTFLFNQQIVIDDDTIGREHLWPRTNRLTHPDFVGIETFDDALTAGRRLIGGILDAAIEKGMHTCVAVQPLEFPIEFRHCLQRPNDESFQLGDLTCAETADLNNPKHVRAVETRFQALIEQWGHADEIDIHLPEHPQADGGFARAWAALTEAHDLPPKYNADALVDVARSNLLVPGGAPRAERELKSAVGMLQFLHDFFAGNDLQAMMRDRGIMPTITLGGSAEPLFPFVHRVLPPGFGMRTSVDYTTSRAVRRLGLLEQVDTSAMRAALTVTLQDDNVGYLPQVATENMAVLLGAASRLGWDGFYTRYWAIGDLDPAVAWLARASWDARVTPHDAYVDHVRHVYGRDAVDTFCQALRMLEDATVILDLRLGPLFPVNDIMRQWLQRSAPVEADYCHVLAIYESVRGLLEQVRALGSGPPSKAPNLDYWLSHVKFSIHALHAFRLLQEAGADLASETESDRQRGMATAQRATDHARTALRTMADQMRDDSDRGALAAYNQFMLREVEQEIAAWRDRLADGKRVHDS